MPDKDVRRETGVSRGALQKLRERHDLPNWDPIRYAIPDLEERIEKGGTASSMSRDTGVPAESILDYIKRNDISYVTWQERTRLDTQIDEEELRECAQTMNCTALADHFGVTSGPLRKMMSRMGIESTLKGKPRRPGGKKSYPPLDKHVLEKALTKGMRRKDMAKEFGCSETFVAKEVGRHGLHFHGYNPPVGPSREELERAMEGAISTAEVTRRLPHSGNTIRLWADRYGLKLPKAGESTTRTIPKDVLEEMLAGGMFKKDMAKKMGCGESTISREMARHGLEANRVDRRIVIPKEKLEEMISRGLFMRDICKETGHGNAVVRREVDRHGLVVPRPPLPRGPRLQIPKDVLRAAVKKNRGNLSAVCRELGHDRKALEYLMDHYGIPIRRKRGVPKGTGAGPRLEISKDVLREVLKRNRGNISAVCRELGHDWKAIAYLMDHYGIPKRGKRGTPGGQKCRPSISRWR
jgi:hypothetical protein